MGLEPALIEEATRKAGLLWIEYAGTSTVAMRHVWHEGAAVVVVGGAEAPADHLARADRVHVVTPSKDNRGRLVTWVADVDVVAPDEDRWAATAEVLAAGRLNAEGGQAMLDRWRAECTLLRLVPTGELVDSALDPSTADLAAPPLPTPATTLGRQPKMIGGLRRRR